MQSLLSVLFPLLDCDACNYVLDEGLASMLGDDELDRLVAAGVLVSAEPARCLPADCGGGCSTHEVVRISRGRRVHFFSICPHDGVDPVESKRLRQWSIDGRAFADVLAAAIQAGGEAETLLPGAAWRIGDVTIGGEPFAVVLSLRGAAQSLSERSGASRMILVGSNVPGDSFAGSLALSEAFSFGRNGILALPHRFRQSVSSSLVQASHAFYRKGDMWVACFEGQETFIKHLEGMTYLARLIAQPDRGTAAVTLLASRLGIDEVQLRGSAGELADEQAVRNYRERYRELMEQIADAEDCNDLGRLEKLQSEQDQLTEELSSVLGKGGKVRENSDAEKIRKSVSNAIKRAIDQIAVHHESLGQHLSRQIKKGTTLVYQQDQPRDWLV